MELLLAPFFVFEVVSLHPLELGLQLLLLTFVVFRFLLFDVTAFLGSVHAASFAMVDWLIVKTMDLNDWALIKAFNLASVEATWIDVGDAFLRLSVQIRLIDAAGSA